VTPSLPARLHAAVPQFTVPDVVRTAEYYRDVLGFVIDGYWATPPAFAIVRRDGVRVFFNRADGITPRTGRADGAYDVYIDVSGVDALAEELARRGADVLDGPDTREYGQREVVVRDVNGLVIAFGENVTPPPEVRP
jgi:catechol 2,3-dioxygenase-like lactoylglutathione lyase family enzyme